MSFHTIGLPNLHVERKIGYLNGLDCLDQMLQMGGMGNPPPPPPLPRLTCSKRPSSYRVKSQFVLNPEVCHQIHSFSQTNELVLKASHGGHMIKVIHFCLAVCRQVMLCVLHSCS